MRIRDIIIIGVAFVCSIICWSQEGSLNFQRGFRIPILDSGPTDPIMPKPLLVDPDGSGSRVLLATTSSGRLSVYSTHYARRRIDDAFVHLTPVSELNVFSPIVGIGAGYTVQNSSIVTVALVTEDYQLIGVSIHTEQPRILWRSPLVAPQFWASLSHAAISVVPERNWAEDEGMVAVAVNVADTSGAEMMMYAAFDAKTGTRRWAYFSDGGNDMDDVLREANLNATQVVPDGAEVRPPLGEVENSGTPAPVHDYLQGRKYEQPWTSFRESVIAAMPHRYAHVWDSQLYPHVIYRAKAKRKARRNRGKADRRATLRYNDQVVHMDTDDYGNFGDKLSAWALTLQNANPLSAKKNKNRRRRPSNAFVFHGPQGVEVVHMFTGNTVTSVAPLKAGGTAYDDINDDLVLESVSTQIGPRSVVYAKHGVDLAYDCMGMIETGLPSSSAELFNATVCDTQGFFGNLDLIHRFVDGDVRGEEAPKALNTLELLGSRNVVSSTTHATPPLIVQVQMNLGGGFRQVERYAVFMIDTGLVTCVDPSRRRVLWRAQTGGHFSSSPEDDMAETKERRAEAATEARPFPQVIGYSLMQKNRETDIAFVGGGKEPFRRVDTYVLAVGDEELSIIKTKNGRVTRSVPLEEPPVAPVLVVDFNGDGTNDLIIVTKYHIFGFVGNSQGTSETVAALMLLLVGMLGILFAVREKNIAQGGEADYTLPVHMGDKVQRKKTIKRSTD